jgi:hypothetical protein
MSMPRERRFEEDRKVVIEREGHTVTLLTAQIKVSPEALNIIVADDFDDLIVLRPLK